MSDRLFVGILGNRNSGKSRTWNSLFQKTVRTGKQSRTLVLRKNECVEVFLVSGSNEERQQYAGDTLKDQSARIILCSMQYVEHVSDTLNYIKDEDFWIYIQWLNPGYQDGGPYFDHLGMSDRLLGMGATLTIRSGKTHPKSRVDELREFIYGWASFRDLIVAC
jgi:hypothetical protein